MTIHLAVFFLWEKLIFAVSIFAENPFFEHVLEALRNFVGCVNIDVFKVILGCHIIPVPYLSILFKSSGQFDKGIGWLLKQNITIL